MPNYKKTIKEIAAERIGILLGLSASVLNNKHLSGERRKALSRHYSRLALEIRNHYKISSPAAKKKACRRCNTLLVPGKTCVVVVASSTHQIIYRCAACGYQNRIHY